MGWGGDEFHGRATEPVFGSGVVSSNLSVLFLTSDGNSKFFCEQLTQQPALMMLDCLVEHDAEIDRVQELVPRTKAVVIATCRASLDKGSRAQEREIVAVERAREVGARIVICSGVNHEACQNHLAAARGTRPLVIVPVHGGGFGEGFMECFPPRTEFLERGDSPEFLRVIAERLRFRTV